jgi:hypothetical protein
VPSFIDTFYDLVSEHLGDPATSRRLSAAQKLRDFYAVERQIWEKVLQAVGQESLVGRVEHVFHVEQDDDYVPLPGNFRQFLSLEKWRDGDRDDVEMIRQTMPYWEKTKVGVEIINEHQGMLWRPVADETEAGDWVLTYLKGPIRIHHAVAEDVSEFSLTMGTPGPDAGTIVNRDNYYVGSNFRVWEADTGEEQTREAIGSSTSGGVTFRYAWDPVPTGIVRYEVCPTMPADYDHLYALKVAMKYCSGRNLARRRRELERDYRDAMRACMAYWTNQVGDRTPTRVLVPNHGPDPYEGF